MRFVSATLYLILSLYPGQEMNRWLCTNNGRKRQETCSRITRL